MAETLYKVLMNGRSCHGGDLKWSLPKGKKPGKWHKIDGGIEICQRGLHLTPKPYEWFKWDCDIYRAEYRGDIVWGDDRSKCAVSEARLIAREPKPEWLIGAKRFIESLKTAKFWFNQKGERLPEWRYFEGETLLAARDAARAAVWGAVGGAARAAVWDAVGDAARAAVWGALGAAAWAAVGDAVGDAARAAVGATVGNAAWGAVGGAAWGAVGDAARDAVWDAARAAVWDATLFVQTDYICAGLNSDKKYVDHAAARWEVWKRGYGLLCDVDGVLYVYGVKKGETGK